MRKGIEIVESMNNKIKGGIKRKMKNVISMGMVGIIVSAMLLASMASPALANENSAASAYTPRAFVYGDANEDATVDMRDVTYINLVLFKKKPETRLADANYDGKISMLDVGQTKLIVLGKEKELTLLDMADRTVTIPQPPERVFAISTGLIGTTMFIFDKEERIIGKGGCTCERFVGTTWEYAYNGTTYSSTSPWAVEAILYPKMADDSAIPYSGYICQENYETIAHTNPDIIIISTRAWGRGGGETCEKSIGMMEKLGIPVVVLNKIACYDTDETVVVYKEIEILGEVFDEQEKAQEIINLLDKQVQFIKERTEDIPEDEKVTVLYAGISKHCSGKGGVAYVTGIDQLESILLENIVNAKNAFRGKGRQVMSAEQILALDPDVIVLPTAQGVHTPDELYDKEAFKELQELRAIKERRVCGLPLIGCRTVRLSFPISLMIEAKCAYPERFADVSVSEWFNEYHRELYGVGDDKIEEIKAGLCLEWLDDVGF